MGVNYLTQSKVDKLNRDIESILVDAVDRPPFQWDQLEVKANTTEPSKPLLEEIPSEPNINDLKYNPKNLWDSILNWPNPPKSSTDAWNKDHLIWLKQKAHIDERNQARLIQYEHDLQGYRKTEHKKHQRHAELQELKNKYNNADGNTVKQFSSLILLSSEYPFEYKRDLLVQYITENKTLILESELPAPEKFNWVKEIKYIGRSGPKLIKYPESVAKKKYETLLYVIVLKQIFEIYRADEGNYVDAIVLNGWVRSIDKATGHNISPCILSIHTNKVDFLGINLKNVDPKECFRKLKGVGSNRLSGLSAVEPIIKISHEDKRFISGYEVTGALVESTNIAAMPWEDFEHLVREVFEKEFSVNGGEVKVTRASRDGGVDAIAFDPDPIRGGKIVIQAKRYTNVVGVSAVRDLYGTVINEGATKGILITTAEYGKDSYDFAKGKPLTLLNGAHLLYLLQKHGFKGRIDLAEAKKENMMNAGSEEKNDSLRALKEFE